MSYAPLDVHYDEHPKYAEFELEHFGLQACGITHCNRLRTDGFVSDKAVRGFGASGKGPKFAAQLVDLGTWTRVKGGYQIVGFLDHNPSRAEIEARQAANRERKKRFDDRRTGNASPERVRNALPDAFVTGLSPSTNTTTDPEDPPVAPPSGASGSEPAPPLPADESRVRAVAADGLFDGSSDHWRSAMTKALQAPQAALKPWERHDLANLVATHAGGLQGAELVAWLGQTVNAFAAAGQAKTGKARPRHVGDWLDAGRPKATPGPRQARPSTLQGHGTDDWANLAANFGDDS